MNLGRLLSAVCGFLVAIPMDAYPYGAGACPGGYAAVGGSHYSGTITTGPLSFGGFSVTLDSKQLSQVAPTNFSIGHNHVLSLQVTTAPFFKGILFRLGSNGKVNTRNALSIRSEETELRLASDTCLPLGAGGVTHTSDDQKSVATTILRLNTVASNLPLDITVVVANDDGTSTFYYSGFTLNAVTKAAGVPPAPSASTRIPPSSKPQFRSSTAHVPVANGGDN
jgi:hypothetical protein